MSRSRGAAIVIGAAIGAAGGYLFLTDDGRRLRLEVEAAAVTFARAALNVQDAAQQALGVASESWRRLVDLLERAEGAEVPYLRG